MSNTARYCFTIPLGLAVAALTIWLIRVSTHKDTQSQQVKDFYEFIGAGGTMFNVDPNTAQALSCPNRKCTEGDSVWFQWCVFGGKIWHATSAGCRVADKPPSAAWPVIGKEGPVQPAEDSAARLDAAQKGFDASLKRFNIALDNYIQVQRAYDLNVGHKALSDSRHVFLSDCKEGPTNPCLFRFGDLVVVETMSYTITAHSGTGKVYVYETMAGIVVGYGEGFQPGAISGTGATFGIDEPASPAVSLFVCDVRDGKWQTCKMPKEFK